MATYSSAALEASAVVSAEEAWLDEVVATNSSAGVLYLQVFDSATVPADTTASYVTIAIPATSTVSWDPRGNKGQKFDNGISVCLSSTAVTKTVAGSVAGFTVRYRAVR